MVQGHTCHTISPFFTRWQVSMYESAYHREPEEVLPYLQTDTSQFSHRHHSKSLRHASVTGSQSSGLPGEENEPGQPLADVSAMKCVRPCSWGR